MTALEKYELWLSSVKDKALLSELKSMTAEEIEEFLRLEAQKNVCGQLKILARRRETLLDAVHEAESKLRCLDYIAYKLRSGEEL